MQIASKLTSLFNRVAFKAEQTQELIIDSIYNLIPDTVFEATILTMPNPGEGTSSEETAVIGAARKYQFFRVRPSMIQEFILPSPWGEGKSAALRKKIILGHPMAAIEQEVIGRWKSPEPGQIWKCRYSAKGYRGLMIEQPIGFDPSYDENPDGTKSDPSNSGALVSDYSGNAMASTGLRAGKNYPVPIAEEELNDLQIPGAFIPATTNITSGYGMRMHPIKKKMLMHNGIDFAGGKRSIARDNGLNAKLVAIKPADIEPSFACFDGEVYKVDIQPGRTSGAGWEGSGIGKVYIKCNVKDKAGNDRVIKLFYIHVESTHLKVGNKVSKGDVVANIGSQGGSTGPHLHFSVYENGKYHDPAVIFGWSIQVAEDIPATEPETPMDNNFLSPTVTDPEVITLTGGYQLSISPDASTIPQVRSPAQQALEGNISMLGTPTYASTYTSNLLSNAETTPAPVGADGTPIEAQWNLTTGQMDYWNPSTGQYGPMGSNTSVGE